jgi:hypothetical protein
MHAERSFSRQANRHRKERVMIARRDPGGMVTVPARPYIVIPAALRRRCGLRAGDHVLLAASPAQDTALFPIGDRFRPADLAEAEPGDVHAGLPSTAPLHYPSHTVMSSFEGVRIDR